MYRLFLNGCSPTPTRIPRLGTTSRGIALGITALLLASGLHLSSATLKFDFSSYQEGETPTNFVSQVVGEGPPAQWIILKSQVDSDAEAGPSETTTRQAVLGQVSSDPTDERFPLFVFQPETFDDFTLTTRMRMVAGQAEQMAGIAFRLNDERNFYVCRASAKGDSFWFYKVVNGQRVNAVPTNLPIKTGRWYELRIACKGSRIQLFLDGQAVLPEIRDTSFSEGKIAFWTKSDSISYFADTSIEYEPRVILATRLVSETMTKYERLLGLDIFACPNGSDDLSVLASSDPARVGLPAGDVEKDVAENASIYYGKNGEQTIVAMPLRDRNGDPVAAVRLVLRRFPGQTQRNALARARPIVASMTERLLLEGGKLTR